MKDPVQMLTRVQRQVKEGIDAVIVDSVLAIRKGLTTTRRPGEEQTDAKPETAAMTEDMAQLSEAVH